MAKTNSDGVVVPIRQSSTDIGKNLRDRSSQKVLNYLPEIAKPIYKDRKYRSKSF